jgi:hypothetical protein
MPPVALVLDLSTLSHSCALGLGSESLHLRVRMQVWVLLSILHDLSNEENVVNSRPASASLRPLDQQW